MRELFWVGDQPVLLLREPYRRRLKLSVNPSGTLSVCASRSTEKRELEWFIQRNIDWIEKRHRFYEDIRARFPPKSFRCGETLPFRGQEKKILFEPHKNSHSIVEERGDYLVAKIAQKFWNETYLWAPQPRTQSLFSQFYKNQAKEPIMAACQKYSKFLGLFPKKVSLRSQRSRWGSCSSNGSISLNWKLIAAPEKVLEYVVLHEISHLRYLNHSDRFWELIKNHMPDFLEQERWLKNYQFAFDFLSKESDLYVSKL